MLLNLNLQWPSNSISPPAWPAWPACSPVHRIPALQRRSVYVVLHSCSSGGIPKRICQFMVKACCVAATNDVPVHMSARRAISPTLSPIQSFLTLLFKKIYSRTHQQGSQRKIAALHGGCFNLMPLLPPISSMHEFNTAVTDLPISPNGVKWLLE